MCRRVVILRGVTYVASRFFSQRNFQWKSVLFTIHNRSSLDAVTSNLYLSKKKKKRKNRYSLVDETTPLETGQRNNIPLYCLNIKPFQVSLPPSLSHSSSSSNLNFLETTCALINFFNNSPLFLVASRFLFFEKRIKKRRGGGGDPVVILVSVITSKDPDER